MGKRNGQTVSPQCELGAFALDNHVLEGKVLALFDLTGGTHDFAFLCTAFSREQPGELAIAVLRLCEAGKLQAGIGGVRLAEACIAAVPQLPACEPVREDVQQPVSEDAEEEERLSLKFEAAYASQRVATEEAVPEAVETDFGDVAHEVADDDVAAVVAYAVVADDPSKFVATNFGEGADDIAGDDVAVDGAGGESVFAAGVRSEIAAANPDNAADEADAAAIADAQLETPQFTASLRSAEAADDAPEQPVAENLATEQLIAGSVAVPGFAPAAEPEAMSEFADDSPVRVALQTAVEAASTVQAGTVSGAVANPDLAADAPICDCPQESHAPTKPLDDLGKALDGDSGAPVADTVPRVFAHDRIAMLRLPKKCEARFLEAGITTVRELVAALDDEDLASQVKPEYVSAAVDALRLCAVEPSYRLSARQLKTLTELSRSKAFAFGVYGGVIDVDAVCQRDGLTILQTPELQVADLPVERLDVPTPTLRKLRMLNLLTVGDVERIGEQGLVEQCGLFPQVAAVIFNQVERLHNQQARERRGEKSPLASFDSKYSKEVLSVLRSVQNEIERLEYPVSREELHVLLAPMAAAALAENAAGHGMMPQHSKAVWQVLKQVDELPETCNALLESVWRRARVAIGDLGEGQSHILVTIPHGGAWKKTAALARRDYLDRGGCELLQSGEKSITLRFSVCRLDIWVRLLPDNLRELVTMRLDGAKNKECAERFEVPDKAIIVKLIAETMASRPFIAEERYLSIFETYDMDAAQFEAETGQPERVYRFLKEISNAPTSGKLPYNPAGEADGGEDHGKHDQATSDSEIIDGGERIALKRGLLVDRLLRSEAADEPVSLQDLLTAYRQMLERHGLADSERLQFSSLRQFASYVYERANVIKSEYGEAFGSEKLRYYDADAHDFAPLAELLSSSDRTDVECGVGALFEDERVNEACLSLDLRNEVELFFALAHFVSEAPGFEAAEYPFVRFGNPNRDHQVKNLIREIGPASAKDLAREYEREYGVPEQVFLDSFLKPFEEYRCGAQYLIVEERADDEQMRFLAEELADAGECCSFALVKSRFEVRFPQSNVKVGDKSTLDRLGWYRSEGLLFKDGVDERAYFGELIDSRDRFSEDDPGFGCEVFRHPKFRLELEARKRAFDIVRISDKQYLSTKPFAKLEKPIRPWTMRDFVNKATAFMRGGQPFTVKTLRDAGFKHELDAIQDELDLGKEFFEYVLTEGYLNGFLKKTSLGDSQIFCCKPGSFTGVMFLEYVLKDQDAFEVEDLVGYLKERYGIEVGASRLRALAKSAAADGCCYYNVDLDMVFASYEAYGRKVQEWL